jgi:hypothetical protein
LKLINPYFHIPNSQCSEIAPSIRESQITFLLSNAGSATQECFITFVTVSHFSAVLEGPLNILFEKTVGRKLAIFQITTESDLRFTRAFIASFSPD